MLTFLPNDDAVNLLIGESVFSVAVTRTQICASKPYYNIIPIPCLSNIVTFNNKSVNITLVASYYNKLQDPVRRNTFLFV